jgi:hypothetical protein
VSKESTLRISSPPNLFADWAAIIDPSENTLFSDAWGATPVRTDGSSVQHVFTTNRAHVLTQATAGERPVYRNSANGIGGQPALQFTAASTQHLLNTSIATLLAGNQPFLISSVYRYTGSGASTLFSFSPVTYASEVNDLWMRNISVGLNDRLQQSRGATGNLQSGDSDNNATLYELEYDLRYLTAYRDGRVMGRVATAGESITPARFALGVRQINTSRADPMQGLIGWWGLRVGTVPQGLERERVRRALARRFGALNVLGASL